jgi:periplasmic copper chaperone A
MIEGLRPARFVLPLLLPVVITASLGAARPATTALVADGAWVRLVPPSQTTTAAFVTLVNRGTADRALVDARTPRANTVELHEMAHEGDRMRMRRVERIAVPAGGQVVLRPGGLHLMLFGLSSPLEQGERVPITLIFDDGSTVDVEAEARMPEGHR